MMKSLILIFLVSVYGEEVDYLKHPLREVSIIISAEGYYPDQISIFEGEKIRFLITSIKKGSSCLSIGEKNFFLTAEQGQITVGEVHFTFPGVYEYYCPTGKIRGLLTVLRRKRVEIEKKKPSTNYWMPKD